MSLCFACLELFFAIPMLVFAKRSFAFFNFSEFWFLIVVLIFLEANLSFMKFLVLKVYK